MRLALVAAAVSALLLSPAATGARAPVAKLRTTEFGTVLTRADGQALYFWTVEKNAGGKIRCTGECARLWPPLIVRSAAAVPKRFAGISGTFGVIRRPGGALQVTRNGLPVYTYLHEGPRQVLCDDVDGWFVVRL